MLRDDLEAPGALVVGAATVTSAAGGRPRAVFGFAITGGKIINLEVVGPASVRQLDLRPEFHVPATVLCGWRSDDL